MVMLDEYILTPGPGLYRSPLHACSVIIMHAGFCHAWYHDCTIPYSSLIAYRCDDAYIDNACIFLLCISLGLVEIMIMGAAYKRDIVRCNYNYRE